MGTSLKRIERKKLDVGLNRLSQFGVDVPRWLAMVDADDATMQRLVAAWPVFSTPYAYDAVPIFGFGKPSEEPLPEVKSGEVVIRYGGWSLRELSESPVVRDRKLMWEQDWYYKCRWSTEKLRSGIYRLRIPVPNSNLKTFAEQQGSLPSGEEPAPVVLVASALLAHRLQTGEELLKNDYTRCKEQSLGAARVGLYWRGGQLRLNDGWGDDRYDDVWLSSVRAS